MLNLTFEIKTIRSKLIQQQMSRVGVNLKSFVKQYPIVRGIVSYAVIWPVSSICQQTIAGRNWKTYDWVQAARYSLFGSCFVAPTLYGWIKIASFLRPQNNLKSAIQKVLIEQVTYAPLSMICFFFGMSILEGKNINQAKEEVRNKFLSTFKVGVCVWPILQTINFTFIPEKNRVPYVSIFSLVWTCFLAHKKQHEIEVQHEQLLEVVEQPEQNSNVTLPDIKSHDDLFLILYFIYVMFLYIIYFIFFDIG